MPPKVDILKSNRPSGPSITPSVRILSRAYLEDYKRLLNDNAGKISEIMERYKNMCYPMESIILGLKKTPPIDHILAPIPLRISHIFDQADMLEVEDLPENDPYLIVKTNNERVKPTLPFSKIFEVK